MDLLTTIDGVTFDEAWRGRVSATTAARWWTTSVATLIRNKRASGRPQDLLDIEGLAAR